MSRFIKVMYVGPLEQLKGEHAIINSDDTMHPSRCRVQFNEEVDHPETKRCLAFGRHVFNRSDFVQIGVLDKDRPTVID